MRRGSGSDAESSPAGRRSRGRRLAGGALRFLAWTLVAVALAIAAGAWFLDSDLARERGRSLVTARLSEVLGRPVSVGDVELGLWPLNLTLYDLVIPGRQPDDPPVARVPEVEVQADLSGLRNPRLHLRQVFLRRPELTIVFDEDGGTNLPELRSSGGGGRVEVTVGSLVVRDGVLAFADRRLPLDLDARSLWLRAGGAGTGSDMVFESTLVSPEVTVVLPDAQPYSGSVRGRATVRSGEVVLSAVHWAAPELRLDADGRIVWGESEREVRVRVTAVGRAELLARLGYVEDPIDGPLQLGGELVSRSSDVTGEEAWSFEGRVESARLDISGVGVAGLAIQPLEARLTVDPAGVHAYIERAGYAAGTVTGTIEVPARADPADSGGDDSQPIRVETALEFERLGVTPLAADWGLDLAGFAGSISGRARYRFETVDPLAGSGTVEVRVAGVERRSGALPLDGAATIEIAAGRARSDDLVVTAQGQRVAAAGEYDLIAQRGELSFDLVTEELGVLYRALQLPSEPGAVWEPTGGTGTLAGDVRIDPSALEMDLRADLTDVRTATLAFDRLAGGLRLVPGAIEDLTLTAARGGGTAAVAGSLPLPADGEDVVAAARDLDLAIDLDAWPAAELAGLLPEGTPELLGAVSGRVEIGGGWESLSASAAVTAEPLTVVGVELERVELSAVATPSALTVEELSVALPAGNVSARGTVGLGEAAGGRQLRAEIDAPGLDLAAPPLVDLFPGSLSGTLVLSATASGSLDAPTLDLALSGTGLGAGGRPLGEDGTAEVTASWRAGELSAEGSLLGLVSLSGGGRLELPVGGDSGSAESGGAESGGAESAAAAAAQADLSFDLANDDLQGLLRVAGLSPPGSHSAGSLADGGLADGAASPWSSYDGRFEGTLTVRGSLAPGELDKLAARLTLEELEIELDADTRLASLEPVAVTLVDGVLEIESFYLGNSAGDELFVAGGVDLTGEGVPLDLRFQGQVDAGWAETLMTGSQLSGTVSVLGSIKGTAGAPRVNGQGEVDQGRAIFSGFPHSLDAVQATLFFNPDGTIVLDRLRSELAGGTLRAQGQVELPSGEGDPVDYRFQARAERFGLRWPEGFLLRGAADLTLTGRGGEQQIVGAVELERAFYLEDVSLKLTQILREALYRQRLQAEATDATLASTQINVSVKGPLRVRNNLADLRGDIDLLVRGTLAAPAIFGQVTLDPGGELTYSSNDYTLERGLLTFSNPYRIDPVIDLVATAEIDRYDITLQLAGTLDRLDASFASDPPLADLEVLQIVATGSAPIDAVGGNGSGTGSGTGAGGGTGASALLYGQAASLVTERVNTLFGFDRFQVNPGIGGGVGFAVGKRLSKDLYVTVSNDPVNEIDYLVQAEWRLTEKVTLVLTQRGNDQYAVDLRWENRF